MERDVMLIVDLLEQVALTGLAALAIAAATVVSIGTVVLGLVALAGELAARRTARAGRRPAPAAAARLRPAPAAS
ncbi:hypothetical protein LG314_00745 [Agrococcus terreus]|uniref:hypothetical protein n=1 Tax=Agrococcus terreus TaxID=574649 RepID=UPI00384AEE6F